MRNRENINQPQAAQEVKSGHRLGRFVLKSGLALGLASVLASLPAQAPGPGQATQSKQSTRVRLASETLKSHSESDESTTTSSTTMTTVAPVTTTTSSEPTIMSSYYDNCAPVVSLIQSALPSAVINCDDTHLGQQVANTLTCDYDAANVSSPCTFSVKISITWPCLAAAKNEIYNTGQMEAAYEQLSPTILASGYGIDVIGTAPYLYIEPNGIRLDPDGFCGQPGNPDG